VEDAWARPLLAFPVVVKPVDNMGARGCRRVDDAAGLQAAIADALDYSRSHRAIVEEYMDGPEFSVDAIVYHGNITITGLADRHIYFPPYFIEMGHTMPTAADDATKQAVLDVFEAGVRALGINDGAAKGDIKMTRAGAMVGEIAARLSGGYMSGWTYPYSSGVNPVAAAVAVATGRAPGGLTPTRAWTSAERAFISIPGVVREVVGVDEARATSGVRDVFMRIEPGNAVHFPYNNVSKCGNIISAAPTRVEAVMAAETAARKVLVRLEVGNAETDAFLDAPLDTPYPPSAFLPTAAVVAGLEAMPADGAVDADAAVAGMLTVAPFPAFMESGAVDYVGRTVQESLDAAARLTGVTLREAVSGAVLGRGFWRALVRGGYQGAAIAIDRALAIDA
jgi:biotin carboxylase